MKQLLSIVILLLIGALNNLFAQKQFEGKIIYDMSYPTTMVLDSVTKKMVPTETMTVTLFFKEKKMRMETLTHLGTNVTIFDSEVNTSTTLINTNGRKTAVSMGKEEMKEEEEEHTPTKEKTKFVSFAETKTIAGYTCQKAEIIFPKKETEKIIVFYTTELKSDVANKNINWIQKRCKGIQGIVLEYEIVNQKGIIYKVTATQVSNETIPDSRFIIPKDYTLNKPRN